MKKWTSIRDLDPEVVSTLDKTTGLTLITFEIFFCYGLDRAPTCYFALWLADDAHIPVVLCSDGIHPRPGGSQTFGSNRDDAEAIDHAAGIWDHGDLPSTLNFLSLTFLPRP